MGGAFEPAPGQTEIVISLRRDTASHIQLIETVINKLASDRWFLIEDNLSIHQRSMLSPEQLDYARQELLKTQSADEEDAFFDAIAEADTRSPEQLEKDLQKILMSKAAYDAAEREVEIEWIAIRREIAELRRTKP